MKKVFVTGAKGFIGQTVCSLFAKSNYSVTGAVRTLDSLSLHDQIKYVAASIRRRKIQGGTLVQSASGG